MHTIIEEPTLVIIKPDGLKKSLTGNILTRLSETKLRIIGAKVVKVTEELAKLHYHKLCGEPFFNDLKDYIMGKPYGKNYNRVISLVYKGENAIGKVREMAGSTNPEEAVATSIRGSFGRITTSGIYENVIHTSATPSEAEREIKLWFNPSEIVEDIYPVIALGDRCCWKKGYETIDC